MSFKNVSKIPILNLSDISSQLTLDEIDNVRVLRQREKENYEKKFLERSKDIQQPMNSIESRDSRDKIINKLRLLLSKKYKLTLNDYIILIDKFKLDTTNLSRNNIVNLFDFLNTQSNYSKQSTIAEKDTR